MAERNRRTVRDLRRTNRAALLRQLYFDGPLSRQELAHDTGLSSGSISNVAAELLAEGLLEEAGSVGSDGGRPRTLLRVAARSAYLIGVDVGETRVRVELFDLTLVEVACSEKLLEGARHDVDRIVRLICQGLAAVLAGADVQPGMLLGVGVGVPGIAEQRARGGAVVHGQTIGWDAVPIEALLRDASGLPDAVPIHVDNGAKTLGQAELWFGAGRGARDVVIALIGSGVGACVVTGGVPYGGAASSAGEWGHTVLTVGGRRCRCGSLGCLEAYVGAGGVLERWREAGGEPRGDDEETALAGLLATAAEEAARADGAQDGARDGAARGCQQRRGATPADGRARSQAGAQPRGAGGGRAYGVPEGRAVKAGGTGKAEETGESGETGKATGIAAGVLAETAEYLGAGIADLVNLFNPERIVLAGWAGLLLGPRLLPAVRRATAAYALRYPAAVASIELGRLGPGAVTVGAATLPLRRFLDAGGRAPGVALSA